MCRMSLPGQLGEYADYLDRDRVRAEKKGDDVSEGFEQTEIRKTFKLSKVSFNWANSKAELQGNDSTRTIPRTDS